MKAETARKIILGVEIPRDELALRIAQPSTGMIAPAGTNATQALDAMNLFGDEYPLGDGFRRAADAAVAYFAECVNAARVPS